MVATGLRVFNIKTLKGNMNELITEKSWEAMNETFIKKLLIVISFSLESKLKFIKLKKFFAHLMNWQIFVSLLNRENSAVRDVFITNML